MPDILCFQEIQSEENEETNRCLDQIMKLLKHKYQCAQLADREDGDGYRPPGPGIANAILVRKGVFEVESCFPESIAGHLKSRCKHWNSYDRSEANHRYVRRKSQTMAIAKLEHISTGKSLLVTSVHISARNEFEARLIQTKAVLDIIESSNESNDPILICGDFNSFPASFAYDLCVKGKLDREQRDFDELQCLEDFMPYTLEELQHPFDLESAYKRLAGEEPELTTKTDDFKGTLDYIFYDKQNLR